MTTAYKIKRSLKGKKLTYVNVEKVLKELGYSVVLFNTPSGNKEIERYNLTHKKNTLKAFTYSSNARIVFIDGSLHSDDRLYLLLHELAHIVLGHVGDGKLTTRNQILIDIEADSYVYSIIQNKKDTSPFILLAVTVLSASLIISSYNRAATFPASTAPEVTEPPKIITDTVYVTPSGNKFHRRNCVYMKGKELIALPRTEAEKNYAPCKVCNP